MKKNQKVAVSILVLIGLAVGLIVGVSLTNPGMNLIEAAGTIGKIDKYRNVKITEQDIELRNDLLTNESLREAYKNYLTYEYTANVKMAEDIQYSMEAAREVALFRTAYANNIQQLENYAQLLDVVRLEVLEAIAVLNAMESVNRIALHSVLNNASSALMQSHYHCNVLFNFISSVQQLMSSNVLEVSANLATAHDLLFADLLSSAIINNDQLAVRYLLSEADFLTKNENLALDKEVLAVRFLMDMERPSKRLMDMNADQMGIINTEQIGVFWAVENFVNFNAEQLASLFQFEKVRALDAEQLSAFFHSERYLVFDAAAIQMARDVSQFGELLEAREQLSMSALSRSRNLTR